MRWMLWSDERCVGVEPVVIPGNLKKQSEGGGWVHDGSDRPTVLRDRAPTGHILFIRERALLGRLTGMHQGNITSR
jgi:hypothetical protein